MANTVLAKMAVQIAANTAEFNSKIAASQRSLKGIETAATQANRVLQSFGVGFGVFHITQGIRAAVSSIAEFEHELSTTKGVTGATSDEFEALRANALKLGASTKFTATEVAQLSTAFGRLGFTTKEIIAASEATLLLATASGEDLAKSADIAGSTLRAFGLDASEMIRVADVMGLSFNRSALQLESFSEAMKFVAPVARAAGVSIEETTALLSILADNGLRGSNAGTALRRILVDLTRDGRPAAARIQELADSGLTLESSFDEVGRIAQTALLVLGNNIEKTKELTAAYNDANGVIKEQARIIEDNLQGDITRLTSAYDGLIQSGGSATNVLREVTQNLTKLVNAVTSEKLALLDKYIRLVTFVPRTTLEFVANAAELVAGTSKLTEEQAKKAVEALNELRKAAKLEGNQDDVQKYTLEIAKITSEYGLLKTKAVEYKETVDGTDDVQTLNIVTLESLRKKKEELVKIFDKIDETDKKELTNIGNKIIGIDAQIAALERLRQKQETLSRAATSNRTFRTPAGVPDLANPFPTTIDVQNPFESTIHGIDTVNEKFEESKNSMALWGEQMRLLARLQQEDWDATTTSVLQYSNVLAQSVAAGIAGQQSFAQVLRSVTTQIIQLFIQRAITAAITNAAESATKSGLPFAAVAAGALAAGAMSGLLSRWGATRSAGGGGSFASSRSSFIPFAQDSSNKIFASTIIRGQDLHVVLSNYERNSQSTRNG